MNRIEENGSGTSQPGDSERMQHAFTLGRCKLNLMDKVKILVEAADNGDPSAVPTTAADVDLSVKEILDHGQHCPTERDQALREVGAAIDALPDHDIVYSRVPALKVAIDSASQAPAAD